MMLFKRHHDPLSLLSWLTLIFRLSWWKERSISYIGKLGVVVIVLLVVVVGVHSSPLQEQERLLEYTKRNYTWPLSSLRIQPKTEGWIMTMLRRLQQIEYTISDRTQRYNAYFTTLASAMIIPNYTQTGWGITRIPNNILQDLQQSLRNGLSFHTIHTLPDEKDVSTSSRLALDGQTKFISQPELNRNVLFSLRRHHECWSNIRLEPSLAYGLRLYTNQSSLAMHVDRLDTHVISSILHIGRSEDAKPWPLYLEDLNGQTQQLYLEVGDMLFYESSKCWHGRPQRFDGSWYTSLFLHYRIRKEDHHDNQGYNDSIPKMNMLQEAHYSVPPHWHVTPKLTITDSTLQPLQVLGTALQEPNCPHGWCGTINTIPWYGPAPEDSVYTRTPIKLPNQTQTTTVYRPRESTKVGKDEEL